MSIQINNQPNQLNTIILPDCVGAHNNSSPSLPPTAGALVQDLGGVNTQIYMGTGLAWSPLSFGNVTGPGLSVNGDLVTWNGITGTAIADSSIPSANVITSTSSNTSGDVPQFNGSRGLSDSGIAAANVISSSTVNVSGNLAQYSASRTVSDSGIVAANVVTGPASSVSTDLASFNGTTGKIVQDSGILTANVVQNTSGTVTSGDLVQFNGTGGRNVVDSNIVAANVVENTGGTVTSGDLVSFSSTTGRAIQDSGISITSQHVGAFNITYSGNNISVNAYFMAFNFGSFIIKFMNLVIDSAVTVTGTYASASGTVPAAYLPIFQVSGYMATATTNVALNNNLVIATNGTISATLSSSNTYYQNGLWYF